MSAVFRCDYCGTYNPLHKARAMYRWVQDLANGDEEYATGVYCSAYCADHATEMAVGS